MNEKLIEMLYNLSYMTSGITIRRATITDLTAICDLSQLLFDYERQFTDEFNMDWSHATEGKEFFIKRLKSRKSFILLAQDENKLVGYILITLEKFAWRAYNPIADVVNLSVTPLYRGKGIGTKLFQQAKKLVIKRGAKRMSVSALTGNIRTLKFYERLGFKDFNVTLVLNPN